ncbi:MULTISPECIES: phage tail protein [unclassified Enterobacter]|uniref:phage tail protein n=1 Tax=unclassified Enterobacter TaxID=2608935 RepID=UPI00292AB8C6|nr:phage tail protein [Enterobacter sp. 23-M-SZ-13]MDV0595752.1 phage tail protein [Enterobacter sp. 23-M-SZ-13]
MATKYYAVLTNVGAAKLANATALGAQVEITQMAVGDGNGALPTPNPAQTALVHELRRAPLNTLSIDPNNANQIIAEQVIPEDVGGWWIREIGLFDKDGDMIAVANCAETYKPQLQEGSGRVQIVRMILIVSSTAAVTLKIDPSVVLATRAYVDSQIIVAKSYADGLMSDHLGKDNPHNQYPLIANALKEMADAGLIGDVFVNLGLGSSAKLAASSAVTSSTGRLTISVLIDGNPSSVLIQWGIVNAARQETTNLTLPVTYDNACLFAIAVKGSAISLTQEYGCGCSPVDKSTIAITNSNAGSGSTQGIRWLTIGY